MIQLAYRSDYALDDGSSAFFVEIARILETALTNNPHLHVTGVLTASGDHFVQILEGPASSVDALFARIALDPRHSGVKILSRRGIATRSFGAWAMAYVGRGDASRIMAVLVPSTTSEAAYQGAVASLADHIVAAATPAGLGLVGTAARRRRISVAA